jgi:hypothetical protein
VRARDIEDRGCYLAAASVADREHLAEHVEFHAAEGSEGHDRRGLEGLELCDQSIGRVLDLFAAVGPAQVRLKARAACSVRRFALLVAIAQTRAR